MIRALMLDSMLEDIKSYYGHSKSDLEIAVSKFIGVPAKLVLVEGPVKSFQDDFDLSFRANGDVHMKRIKDVEFQRNEQPLILKGKNGKI